jgi:hypothetical protein
MTHKAITLKFVVLTVLALAPGIMISIGAANLKDKHPSPSIGTPTPAVAGIAELPNLDLRLWRVHLLLSSVK